MDWMKKVTLGLTTIKIEATPIIRPPTIETQPLMLGVSVPLDRPSAYDFVKVLEVTMDIPGPQKRGGQENRSPHRQRQVHLGGAAIWSVHSTPSRIEVRVDRESELWHARVSVNSCGHGDADAPCARLPAITTEIGQR